MKDLRSFFDFIEKDFFKKSNIFLDFLKKYKKAEKEYAQNKSKLASIVFENAKNM